MTKRGRRSSTADLFDVASEFQHYPFWLAASAAFFVLLVLEVGVPVIVGRNLPISVSGVNYAGLVMPFVQIIGWVFAGLILLFGLVGALTRLARSRRDAALFEHQTSLTSIQQLTWREFERLLDEAYRRQGYDVRSRGGPIADGGVDLELRKGGETLLVQAKHWKTRLVHLPQLRELWGAVADEQAHGAILITSGSFTADAERWARGKNFRLIDGEHLAELIPRIRRNQVAIPQSTTRTQTCPRCGRAMVQRTARRGAHTGEVFWGCTGYPGCKQIEKVATSSDTTN